MSKSFEEFRWDDLLEIVKTRVDMNDENIFPLASIRRRNGGFFHRETKYGKDILTKTLSKAVPGCFAISKMQVVHGACSYVPENFAKSFLSASYTQFKAKNPPYIDTKFMHYYAHSHESYSAFLKSSHGVHIEKMTFDLKDWLKQKVRIPPLPEQKKIASILKSMDEVIENTHKQIDKLQDLKKATMNELLTKGIGHTEFKGSELGSIPKCWKIASLSDHASRIHVKNDIGNTNVLTASAIDGLISQKEYFNKSVASSDISHYTLLQKGDFAYNKSYSRGCPVGVVRQLNRYDLGVLSPLYICFSIISNSCDDIYLSHYFDSYFFERELNAVVQEGARAHGLLNISVNDFFERKIVIPPLSEQKKIVSILTSIMKQIDQKKQKLTLSQSLKKALLQDLLTGKVRVQIN